MKDQETKLHLGCGKRYLQGWVHVDLANYPHIDYPNQDIADLSIFKGCSVSEIYVAHAFEYFTREEAIGVLEEWHHVLIAGGILRISVPDFQSLVDVYIQCGNLALIHGLIFGNMAVKDTEIWHHTVYDEASLSALLLSAGFRGIHRWDWRDFFPPGYDDYSAAYIPHMDFENGTLVSLNLMGVKR